MRYALLLLAAFVASPCLAQFVFVPYIFHSNSTFSIPITDPSLLSPLDYHFEYEWPGAPDGFKFSYTLKDLTLADKGKLWEIYDAAAGNEIGLDYDRVVDLAWTQWPERSSVDDAFGNQVWLLGEPKASIDTPLGTFPKGSCCGVSFRETHPGSQVKIEYARIYISRFDYHERDQVTYVTIQTYLIGERDRPPAPEPASAALMLLGLCGLPLHRKPRG